MNLVALGKALDVGFGFDFPIPVLAFPRDTHLSSLVFYDAAALPFLQLSPLHASFTFTCFVVGR